MGKLKKDIRVVCLLLFLCSLVFNFGVCNCMHQSEYYGFPPKSSPTQNSNDSTGRHYNAFEAAMEDLQQQLKELGDIPTDRGLNAAKNLQMKERDVTNIESHPASSPPVSTPSAFQLHGDGGTSLQEQPSIDYHFLSSSRSQPKTRNPLLRVLSSIYEGILVLTLISMTILPSYFSSYSSREISDILTNKYGGGENSLATILMRSLITPTILTFIQFQHLFLISAMPFGWWLFAPLLSELVLGGTAYGMVHLENSEYFTFVLALLHGIFMVVYSLFSVHKLLRTRIAVHGGGKFRLGLAAAIAMTAIALTVFKVNTFGLAEIALIPLLSALFHSIVLLRVMHYLYYTYNKPIIKWEEAYENHRMDETTV